MFCKVSIDACGADSDGATDWRLVSAPAAQGAPAGTVQLVQQKRAPSSSPQDLLAQVRNAPQEVINEKLDALATGARTDSDLYQSTLTILPTGQDGYSLQQSTKEYTPQPSANPALTLESDQQPTAPPAAPSGGNTLLSRAALAANAAPTPAPVPTLLGHDPPVIRAYPPETAVAEKVEAMCPLGIINSRMKD
jgi:hypothetical protein